MIVIIIIIIYAWVEAKAGTLGRRPYRALASRTYGKGIMTTIMNTIFVIIIITITIITVITIITILTIITIIVLITSSITLYYYDGLQEGLWRRHPGN